MSRHAATVGVPIVCNLDSQSLRHAALVVFATETETTDLACYDKSSHADVLSIVSCLTSLESLDLTENDYIRDEGL